MLEKKLDKQNRISLGTCLIELAGLQKDSTVALCFFSENRLILRPMNNIKGYKVVDYRKIDSHGRLVLSKGLKYSRFIVYVTDGELFIEGVT